MNAPQACPAPTRALRRLAAFLSESGSTLSAVDAATLAINQWIATQRGQLTSVVPTPTRGYQWKTLFLPEGSELRINFERESFHVHAAAACMSETLKTALALVEHTGSGDPPATVRSTPRRRADDEFGDSVAFDD